MLCAWKWMPTNAPHGCLLSSTFGWASLQYWRQLRYGLWPTFCRRPVRQNAFSPWWAEEAFVAGFSQATSQCFGVSGERLKSHAREVLVALLDRKLSPQERAALAD